MSRIRKESNEDVYYSDGYVWVTSRRVVHGSGEHLLSGARGVRVRVVRAEDRLRNLVIYLLLLTGLYVALLLNPVLADFRVALIYLLPILACIFIWLLATSTRTNMSREPIYRISRV